MLERIETRAAEIGGGLIIARALPNRQRRMVGARCFLDHAGPMEFARGVAWASDRIRTSGCRRSPG
jgi:redox-sensitive bicupin YhaK (pirin superfamily)